MVTLSLCMVIDNTTGELLVSCLNSVKDIADEIIIVDTGASDNIVNICNNFTDKIYKLQNSQDFEIAWNYSFSMAKMDYIMWLDGDDLLLDIEREKLIRLKESMEISIDAVTMLYHYNFDENTKVLNTFRRNRIVKRNDFFTWQSGLNCFLAVNGRIKEADITVTQNPLQKSNIARRLSVYEHKLEKGEKLTPHEMHYYADNLRKHNLYEKAIYWYKEFLKEKDGFIGDKFSSCDKLADIYREKNDKSGEKEFIYKSFEYGLPRAEFLYRLGVLFTEQNELDIAIFWYKQALAVEKPKDNLGFFKAEYWTYLPHLKLCGCYFRQGDMDEAYRHNEMALSLKPGDESMLHNKRLLEGLLKKKSEVKKLSANLEVIPKKSLKIVQVAPDVYPVPPDNYGGIEVIIYEITEELVKRGHEVYLYAPKGSKTSANLIPYEHAGRGDFNKIAEFVINTMPDGVDIIHDHTHISVLGKKNLQIPTICTIHGTINYRVNHPVFVSKRALEVIGKNHGYYVYNGLNLKEYEFSEDKGDYLLYLGRLDKMKGIDHALFVAEKTKKKLIIAGPIHDMGYFTKEVEPRIKDNSNIEYIGSVGGKKKQEVLKNASCLLFPTSWEEPFGLVMIEAFACGTPVLAFANGAVPEVLKGFPELICNNAEEMAKKVTNGEFPLPNLLREYALDNFTTEKMVDGYLEVYQKVRDEHNDYSTVNILKNNTQRLRIVQVSPDVFPVPPKDYGGIERVIYDLTEELVRSGHEVYLYAAQGSRSSATIIPYSYKGPDSKQIADFVIKTLPENIDIIHDHTHAYVLDKCGLSIPVVNTMHDSRKNSAANPVYLCKKALENVGMNKGFYAYNGINPDDYEFNEIKEDYLIFMGLLYSHKGIKYALDLAERTKQKLIIAGPIYEMEYYKKEIEPRIKASSNISYVGSVGGKERQSLLKNARCMLFPTVWEEPFGLVMVEAMACGTPVLAFPNGAVPEVLEGFPSLICCNVDDMIHKLQNQTLPESKKLREYVVNNFSARKMADNYLNIYNSVIKQPLYLHAQQ